ncbi:hypothetical protein SH1V18_27070 [Vallitalea longa]|uniref:Probable membrane transporter protein n=1 Tax=Vallitalea longa TaxID=2936439 RepID=A0A9W6DG65_9FIRM|nr:sulfite exporter TauE/SafE family protein [Vallitalea longa]GKX30227.1 hypothetical protein SH1V18_27070 [Vallitalea longa]
MTEKVLTLVICFGGGLIQGLSGFGFAMFVMFFIPFIMPLKVAAIVTGLQTFFMGTYVVAKFRKHINYKIAVVPLVSSLVLVPIGVRFLVFGDEHVLKKILGVTIVVISIFLYIKGKKEIKIKTNVKNGILAGSLSGIMSGMFNVGGPPLVVYYLYGTKDRLSYKATLEFSFLTRSIMIVIMHAIYGNINGNILTFALYGGAGTIVGNLLGLSMFQKINSKLLHRIVILLMFILGCLLIIRK